MKARMVTGILALAAGLSGCGRAPDSIVPYGRENNSGTYMYFKEHVLGEEDFAAKGTRTVEPNWHLLYGPFARFEEVARSA